MDFLNGSRTSGLRRLGSVAVGGLLAVLAAGSAHALTYTSGDLVAVFVNNGNELIADLGPLASLASGTPTVIPTSSILGSTGGDGGIVAAFETNSPFTGTVRSIVFATATSVTPTSFDNNFSQYVSKIPAAQSSLDAAGTVSGGGWLQNLNGFPAAGSGTPPVLINTATLLGIAATSPSSYSKVLNASGLNEINGTMPFSTAATLSTDPEVVDLWSATRTGLTTSSTTLLGTLTVDGNVAGTSGGEVAITFSAVPEPGTLVLVAAGLSGLVWAGRGRRTE